jgi:hypothetical protein
MVCKQCSKTFQRPSKYDNHMKICERCKQCNKWGTPGKHGTLNKHKRKAHPNRIFSCGRGCKPGTHKSGHAARRCKVKRKGMPKQIVKPPAPSTRERTCRTCNLVLPPGTTHKCPVKKKRIRQGYIFECDYSCKRGAHISSGAARNCKTAYVAAHEKRRLRNLRDKRFTRDKDAATATLHRVISVTHIHGVVHHAVAVTRGSATSVTTRSSSQDSVWSRSVSTAGDTGARRAGSTTRRRSCESSAHTTGRWQRRVHHVLM